MYSRSTSDISAFHPAAEEITFRDTCHLVETRRSHPPGLFNPVKMSTAGAASATARSTPDFAVNNPVSIHTFTFSRQYRMNKMTGIMSPILISRLLLLYAIFPVLIPTDSPPDDTPSDEEVQARLSRRAIRRKDVADYTICEWAEIFKN